MEFSILGPLEVRAAGEAIPLGGARQRALLALLLLHANEVVTTERLIEELWGADPPATAAHAIQVYVSNLRKVLAGAGDADEAKRLVKRPHGYLLRVEPGELDLDRFERLVADARRVLGAGAAQDAARMLREALKLWTGAPLADFAYDVFAQAAIARLEELHALASEDRVEAELACGRHRELVPELEALVAMYPLRERLRAHLMLALYRSGRQAEALEVFQQTRRVLVDELGIDPSPALQQLERAILRQDQALSVPRWESSPPARSAQARPQRSLLVAVRDTSSLDPLLELLAPLAVSPSPHELIVILLTEPVPGRPRDELAQATAALEERRSMLLQHGASARVAAFASSRPDHDLVRFAEHEDIDLLLVSIERASLAARRVPEGLVALDAAPCDVAFIAADGHRHGAGEAVLVPFGAHEHDWAALELGAWFASAHGWPLRLLGALAPGDASQDASRLLAHAAIAVQQLVHVETEPVLVQPGPEDVLAAADKASMLVVGVGEGWKQEGVGATRAALARASQVPTTFVRRGLRPGGLAPREGLTRFTWSLGVSA